MTSSWSPLLSNGPRGVSFDNAKSKPSLPNMDCTITSCMGLTEQARCRAMALVELMVATGVGSIVLAAMMSLTFFSARSFAAVTNYVELDARSRSAIDKMSQEIRQTDGLAAGGYSATQL